MSDRIESYRHRAGLCLQQLRTIPEPMRWAEYFVWAVLALVLCALVGHLAACACMGRGRDPWATTWALCTGAMWVLSVQDYVRHLRRQYLCAQMRRYVAPMAGLADVGHRCSAEEQYEYRTYLCPRPTTLTAYDRWGHPRIRIPRLLDQVQPSRIVTIDRRWWVILSVGLLMLVCSPIFGALRTTPLIPVGIYLVDRLLLWVYQARVSVVARIDADAFTRLRMVEEAIEAWERRDPWEGDVYRPRGHALMEARRDLEETRARLLASFPPLRP